MLTVDVVIPVYGQWELTAEVLASLRERDACVRRVIVADDASPDDSAARLRERSDIDAVLLPENAGFGGTCNAGARAGDADAIFFLNNDTLVPPGAIARLAQTMDETGAAAVGPRLLHGDGTLQVAGLAMLPGVVNMERLFVYLDADLIEGAIAYEPVALSGAALLVRRDAFERVGGFDDAYRNGSEDVDLCLKLWAAGLRCRYEPRATIVHLEGASRGKDTDNSPNDRILRERWLARCADVPRLTVHPPPLLDLRWRSHKRIDATAGALVRETLRRFAGARVVTAGESLARVAARLDGRRRLSIEHAGRGASADVVWCAPADATAATQAATRDAARYWVPSRAGAQRLAQAGVDPERIAVVRPGYAAADPPVRSLDRAAIVRRAFTPAAATDALRAALAPLPAEICTADDADPATIARIAATPLVVFADPGDAWGIVGTAALAHGAVVVAYEGDAFVEIMPDAVSLRVRSFADACDAARAVARDPGRYAELGPRAARAIARRTPDLHAGRRVRELARAAVHGVPDPRRLTMPADTVALLRATP